MTTIVEAEEQMLREAYAKHAGNKRAVAEALGVSLKTIYTKLHKYKIGSVRALKRRPTGAPELPALSSLPALPDLPPLPCEPSPTKERAPLTPTHLESMDAETARFVAEQIAIQLEAGHIEGARHTLETEWRRYREARAPLTPEAILALPLGSTALDVRVVNTLEQRGLLTIGDLLQVKQAELLNVRSISHKTLDEIIAVAREWAAKYDLAVARRAEANAL